MNSICNYLVATATTHHYIFPRNLEVYLELEQNTNVNNPSIFIKSIKLNSTMI